MSDLEKISAELIVIAYQDNQERVDSLEKLEKELPKLTSSFPEEEKKLIKQIVSELKEEADMETEKLFGKRTKIKPAVLEVEQEEIQPITVKEEEIEVVEPIELKQTKIIQADNKESKFEDDFSFLEDIDNAF